MCSLNSHQVPTVFFKEVNASQSIVLLKEIGIICDHHVLSVRPLNALRCQDCTAGILEHEPAVGNLSIQPPNVARTYVHTKPKCNMKLKKAHEPKCTQCLNVSWNRMCQIPDWAQNYPRPRRSKSLNANQTYMYHETSVHHQPKCSTSLNAHQGPIS